MNLFLFFIDIVLASAVNVKDSTEPPAPDPTSPLAPLYNAGNNILVILIHANTPSFAPFPSSPSSPTSAPLPLSPSDMKALKKAINDMIVAARKIGFKVNALKTDAASLTKLSPAIHKLCHTIAGTMTKSSSKGINPGGSKFNVNSKDGQSIQIALNVVVGIGLALK